MEIHNEALRIPGLESGDILEAMYDGNQALHLAQGHVDKANAEKDPKKKGKKYRLLQTPDGKLAVVSSPEKK